ncbi:MAG TPA: sigma-70 family RNA polymerase sigma factor [Thermoanaerobaculia bacterium]|nr:sigma-70 family RNA polymerase sigma factor [Thermoanaerobaculia bacterium]
MSDDDLTFRLIEQIQAGVDVDESFRRLHDLHYRRVRNHFLYKGFSPEESRDLTQDVFLRVFKGIGGFRRESRFEKWLFKIVHNLLSNEVRGRHAEKRERKETSLDAAKEDESIGAAIEIPSQDPSVLDEAVEKERLQALRQALAGLPPQMRLCCELRYVKGFKYQEIAVLMKISIETVKAHLHQARKRLMDKLGDPGGEGGRRAREHDRG